jgi:hypothetical protein
MPKKPKKFSSGNYEVGYCKPPYQTRFQKGVSGNPGGRPRGMTMERANMLALKEAYRLIPVREGGKVSYMPAMQAVMRGMVTLAAKGNGPAQRACIEMVQAVERQRAARAEAKAEEEAAAMPPVSHWEIARRIAFLLTSGADEANKLKSPSILNAASPTEEREEP